jgi:hypothetical protein
MSEPTFPQQPDLPPPPPPPVGSETWATHRPEPARRRPRGLLVGALVAALALVAGVVVAAVLGGRGSSAAARPLALSFTPGDRETYRFRFTMDGTLDAGELLGETPLDMDVTEVLTWEVTDVDEDGVATIRVTVEELSGTVNGVEAPTDPSQLPAFDMRIAPDGRVLEAGGLSFAGADVASGASFPGMGQMTPLLPDHPVAPGDRWTTSFSQDNPFGEGEISYEATSTFEREEELDGVRVAVIRTEMTTPVDLTISFDDLLAAMGADVADSPEAEGLRGVEIVYGGKGSITQRAWVDLEAERTLKVASSGTFDMTMTFHGLDALEGQEMGFRGDLTIELRVE